MPRRNDRARAAIPNSWSVQRSASVPTWIARSMRWSASCRRASCSTARSRIFASTAATWRSRVGDSVRRNPVPILLTVAGLGWLIVSSVRTRDPIDVTPIDVTRRWRRHARRRIHESLRRPAHSAQQVPRSRSCRARPDASRAVSSRLGSRRAPASVRRPRSRDRRAARRGDSVDGIRRQGRGTSARPCGGAREADG